MYRKYFILLFISLFSKFALSQELGVPATAGEMKKAVLRDSTSAKVHKHRDHRPTIAMVLSTCVPGLGQAYNKKYWKIPIIYAGLATTLYFFNTNNTMYHQYKEAYINRDTANAFNYYFPSSGDTYKYSMSQLQELEISYHNYRDLNILIAALCYVINITDAYVDAQLKHFDVSDNLSWHIEPTINTYSFRQKPSAGLTLSVRF